MVEQKYIDYWKNRQLEEDAQSRVWEKEAWVTARKAVALLRQEFGVTKAVVFGSLVKNRFGEDSDIDLAVEGLEFEDLFKAMSAVNNLTTRWIDLKPMEDLEPRFKEEVLATGTVIQ